MKYRLVQRVEGQWVQTEFTEDNVLPAMEVRGFALRGLKNRSNREELQGQPMFAGVLGPMWDGDAVRYECPESNRILSE